MSGHAGSQNFAFSSSVIKDGLVLYLDATSSLVSSSYGLAGDNTNWNSIAGPNGILVNSPTYTGSVSGSLNFNGTNQYVNLGNSLNSLDVPFTIISAFSFNSLPSTPADWQPIISWGNGDIQFRRAGGSTNFCFSLNAIDMSSVFTLTAGAWYIVACVADTSINKMIIYKNGVFDTSGSFSGARSKLNMNVILGIAYNLLGGINYFPGKIGFVSVYNRALSLNEVTASYSGSKGRFGL